MFKEKTKIKDKAVVNIKTKSPEEIEKIKRGDPAIDELKRRRKQTPNKWYPVAGNAADVFEQIWPNLIPGTWLRIVYANGNVLSGRVKEPPNGSEIVFEQDTILLNFGICNTDVLAAAGTDVIQVFVDTEAEAVRIRSLRV